MMKFDVAVIGGGPGGYVAAIKAAQSGKKTVIIEKNVLGGVCLNCGCIPTKALIKSISALDELKKCSQYGITGVDAKNIDLDFKKVQARKQQIVKRLTDGVKYLLTANGVQIIFGTASLINSHLIIVNDETIEADNIIIAAGSATFRPPIPIKGDANVITSDEALQLADAPNSIVVIGGGAIGIEFSYILNRMGSKVTVIEMLDSILPRVDEEIKAEAAKILKGLGIDIITGAKVIGIDGKKVNYELAGAEKSIDADTVLLAVGRVPCAEGLNVEAAGIKMDRKAIAVDEYLRTSNPNIYAIGDVNGKVMLAHTASMEGIVAVENICGNAMSMDYQKIPQCIYIKPEIASVGLTEKEAKEIYGQVKVGTFPLAANGKAIIEDETAGFIKVIVSSDVHEILGAHIMGPHATDMIAEIALAMGMEATADIITNTIHPHPTVSEIIPEAFHAALHKAIHFM